MKTIQTRRRIAVLGSIDLFSWVVGCLCAAAFFAIQAAVGTPPDAEELAPAPISDAQLEREHDVQLLNEVGAIAREAHAQGMREALASVQGTPDGEALQRSCARLWGMEHEQ